MSGYRNLLNEPEIRDEALQVLRGLVERISIGTTENGLEVEIVGEIAKMVELGTGNKAKRATLDEAMTRCKGGCGALQPALFAP